MTTVTVDREEHYEQAEAELIEAVRAAVKDGDAAYAVEYAKALQSLRAARVNVRFGE